ncbi:hypothetical protein DITRI_Ditri06bG0166200 [Diplodiscus trichospermus]
MQDVGYQVYKGYLKDIPVFVKKYDQLNISAADPYKDIAIGSQMRAHKNVSKILGRCLETEEPIIVYKYAGTKTLTTCISATNVEPLPWKCRLKIAIDLANAIAYLHTALHRPVIRQDIKCSNIILDQNYVPKLFDFGLCNLSEKFHVFCFGRLLVDLFTGNKQIHEIIEYVTLGSEKNWIENFSNVVDPRITKEVIEVQQLLDFATLISRCMCKDAKKRPTMIEVAKELRQIYQSFWYSPTVL